MAEGLIRRYEAAGAPPPVLMYTDRDCCRVTGGARIGDIFAGWPDLKVSNDRVLWRSILLKDASYESIGQERPLLRSILLLLVIGTIHCHNESVRQGARQACVI